MKKILSIFTTLTLTTTLSADLLRIHAGGGLWNQTPTGLYENSNDRVDIDKTLGYGSDTNFYLWGYVKHFIPLVPNFRVEASQSHFSGEAKSSFIWEEKEYSAGSLNALDIKQYDAILYYNLLDNTFWITIDLGIEAKYVEYATTLDSDSVSDESFVLPMLYARARVEIPSTNLAIEADLKTINIDSASMNDLQAKIHYTFDTPVLQPGIELGYRYENIAVSSQSTLPVKSDIDIAFDGFYGGVTLAF